MNNERPEQIFTSTFEREVVPFVDANSTNNEILNAIRIAGGHRFAWRRSDWPRDKEKNQHSWVRPRDIGRSTRKDQSLTKRLNALAAVGLLERRFACNMPRYRVVLDPKVKNLPAVWPPKQEKLI